nr:serine carboxypeptidase-like 45 [Populus alba]
MLYKPDGYVLYRLCPAKSLNIPFFCAAEANMLYLESPAGVGFSYSAKQSFYALLNDTITELKISRLSSLQHKTVSYSWRNGHYVPQLTYLISQSGLKSNLKGFAVSTE